MIGCPGQGGPGHVAQDKVLELTEPQFLQLQREAEGPTSLCCREEGAGAGTVTSTAGHSGYDNSWEKQHSQ